MRANATYFFLRHRRQRIFHYAIMRAVTRCRCRFIMPPSYALMPCRSDAFIDADAVSLFMPRQMPPITPRRHFSLRLFHYAAVAAAATPALLTPRLLHFAISSCAASLISLTFAFARGAADARLPSLLSPATDDISRFSSLSSPLITRHAMPMRCRRHTPLAPSAAFECARHIFAAMMPSASFRCHDIISR